MPGRIRLPGPRRHKYGAVACTVDGVKFASRREADAWRVLLERQRCGEIVGLQRQVRIPLHAETGLTVGNYVADFVFWEGKAGTWNKVIADAKGVRTDLYRWKAKHVRMEYGITIREL